jgi:hypothetical protein
VKPVIDQRIRDGIFAALVAVVTALALRFWITNPQDYLHYSVLEELTGIDFGTWPNVFYTGGGGDGEVFAVLAADPLGSGPSQLIPVVIHRFLRIGFAWLAWAFSLGQEQFVLPALFTVGLLAVSGVGFMSGFLRERLGLKSWALLISPAVYIGFMGDTVEPLGTLLLVLSLTASGIWAAAALGISRPTYAVALVGKWKLLSAAAAVVIVIRLLAVGLFGGSIFESIDGSFSLPFVAYFDHASVVGFLVLAGAVVTIGVGVMRRDLAWVAAGMFVAMLGGPITDNPINAVRAAGMLPVLWAFGPNWRGGYSAYTNEEQTS